MKKGLLILTTAMMVALLLASFLVVSAEAKAPIECVIDIEYYNHDGDDIWYWYGPVSGCILEGYIRFDEDVENPSYVAGKTLHFFEKFTIYDSNENAIIYGKNAGVGHIFKKFNFRANGWVTGVEDDDWEYLIGYKTFEKGTSSDPLADPPVTAHGTVFRLVPAQRSSTP